MDYVQSDLSPFSWRASSPLAVRVAGLPASVLAELEFQAFPLIMDAISLDEQLIREGNALSAALFESIGRLARPDLRAAAVGLRRAVHQVRRPTRKEWNESVASALPESLAARVGGWVDSVERRHEIRLDLRWKIASETDRKLAGLREITSDPSFRRALCLASRSLSDELEKWLADDGRRPQRQKLLRLERYIIRAASKTSPYSTFAASGFVTWGSGNAVFRYRGQVAGEGVTELDGTYLSAIRQALARRPELADVIPVRINPSARVTPAAVEFIGRPGREPIITVGLTSGLRKCLQLADGNRELTLGTLRRELTAAAQGAEGGAAEGFLDRLAALGLLELYVPVADHAHEPAGELRDWLHAMGGNALAQVTALLGEIHAELTRHIPRADVAAYRRRQTALHRSMIMLAQRLGLPPAIAGTASQPAVHEACVAPRPLVVCSARQWRPALNDLDVIRRWLTVFDVKLPARIAVGAYCRERFGAGARLPFTTLYRAVQDEIAQETTDGMSDARSDLRALFRDLEPWSVRLADRKLPRLRELAGLRAEARAAARPAGDDAGELRADPDVLAKVVRDWPGWITVPGSALCYIQVCQNPGDVEFVLNMVHGGYGRARSRLAYLTSRAGGSPPPVSAWAATGREVALAELGGLFGSTLNIREPAAPFEIDYPFSVSGRPVQQRLPLRDLLAVHDESKDCVELFSAGLGTKVVPLHLGMMANFQLPPAARFLEQVFGTAYLMHPVAPVLIPREDFSLPGTIDRYPRVSIGHIVVQRARWVVNGRQIPQRGEAEEAADYLVRLTGWMRANGIPQGTFIRFGSGGFRGEDPKSRKPVYFDQANLLSMLNFERLARASEFVIFEEALPDPVATVRSGPGSRVTEFLVELTDGLAGDD